MNRRIIVLTVSMASLLTAGAVAPMWTRDVRISPDGKTIAFTYKGDIYSVGVNGGRATRLTSQPSLEWAPVWSPDGTKIAFASDRNGGSDVYIMDATGGTATRLTYHSAAETPMAFTPDGLNVVFGAAIQDTPSSAMFPTGRLTEVYKVPVGGGRVSQILSTPAEMISYLPDGQSFLYHDVKGLENIWRKHHTSSVTRDIWMYDAKSGKHTNLTNRGGEDRNPVLSPDKKRVYFLSERDGGSFNVYSFSLDNPAAVTAETDFKTHPVRFLSQGADGTLAFAYDGEIWTKKPGQKAVKPAIDVVIDEPATDRKLRFGSGDASEALVSPDGKQMALVYRGDVFVTSVEHPSIKQITNTPQAEGDLSWSDDSKTLYYTSERDGHKNIYSARAGRPEDPNFSNATVITEKALFDPSEGIERNRPMISPDGKKMAFIEDRSKIMVMDLASKKVKQITDGTNYPQRDGGFAVEWAPDSRWLAAEIMDRRHDPYADIAIIDTETLETINLTNSGYFDMAPHWVLGGDAILFNSERYGMRNHASWGSMNDAMLIFLNRDAYDKYRLSEEDFALAKEVEKAQKKEKSKKDDTKASKKKSKNKGKDAEEKNPEPAKAIKIDRKGLEDRVVRLTPMSSDITAAALSDDGETLYYVSGGEEGTNLWKVALRKDDISLVKKLGNGRVAAIQTLPDGSAMFLLGNSIKKLDPKSSKLTPVNYSGDMMLDPGAERAAMLDFVYNEEKERFYNPNMHGVDWKAMTDHYRTFLPHIANNSDFSDLLSELLGELNVSHTGSGVSKRGPVSPTASLGVLYDMTFQGPGLRVAEIIENGPFDRSTTAMTPGAVITAINGQQMEKDEDPMKLLNGLAGKKTLVTFTTTSGAEKSEVILPLSQGSLNAALYDRWVKGREHYVDSISGGRLGYIHLQSMSDPSFRNAYSNVLGKYNDREGIVIDTRWNGGGRLHEDIEVLFSGKKYFTQVVRGRESCDMPSRRWNKPSIMVQCEANYSNAHGTPWVYKHVGLGKLVGAPVPGTMTSVNWVDLQDPSLYFGIPVVGYRLPDGSYLENKQLEPDILVLNDPATVVNGDDAQLRTAIEELLREIDSAK